MPVNSLQGWAMGGKSKPTDGSGKKELIKMWDDMVVCISKALGLYIFQGS